MTDTDIDDDGIDPDTPKWFKHFIKSQFRQLVCDIHQIKENIEEIKDNVKEIEENIEKIEDNVKEIEDSVKEIEDNVKEIKDDMSNIKDLVNDTNTTIYLLDCQVGEVMEQTRKRQRKSHDH